VSLVNVNKCYGNILFIHDVHIWCSCMQCMIYISCYLMVYRHSLYIGVYVCYMYIVFVHGVYLHLSYNIRAIFRLLDRVFTCYIYIAFMRGACIHAK
jgi:hypothetical protein